MPSLVTLIALGLLLFGLLTSVVLGFDLKSFLGRVPELASSKDLDEFRRVVARQMYGALFLIVCAVAAAVVMIAGAVLRLSASLEWVYLLALAGAYAPAGIWVKSVEAKVKTRPAEGEYARERDEIVQVWMKRALPNW